MPGNLLVDTRHRLAQSLFPMSMAWLAVLAGCAADRPAALPSGTPAAAQAAIARSLPPALDDRAGWVADIYAGFRVLSIDPSRENICAVAAVIGQESGFRVDPAVPGLAAIAWREIDSRAQRAGVPTLIVHGVLNLKSKTGASYSERIDAARTERALSDVYEDLIGAVPLGQTLFAGKNPIRTRGPMQVHIAFAAQFAASHPYPYPVERSIPDEVFTRRGGVYFGVAHLLDYAAPYDAYRYRFADFNAGQYASRNAAFQAALSIAAGIPLVTDGALLSQEPNATSPGSTELAARTLAVRLDLTEGAIRSALERGKTPEFADTELYRRVFALAERLTRGALPRARLPRIELSGPKITRRLTTAWYADRVDARFKRCLNAATG